MRLDTPAGPRRRVAAALAGVVVLCVASCLGYLATRPDDTVAPAAGSLAAPSTSPSTSSPSVSATPRPTATATAKPPARAKVRTTATPRATSKPRTTSKPRATTKPRTISKPRTTTQSTSDASAVIALVNAERAKAGCRAVSADAALTRAAAGHSTDMATHDYFSHVSQDGRTFDQRIHAAGYSGGLLGENIAAGQSTPAAVMSSWMNSAGHRANILNCGFHKLGVGVAKGGSYGVYWTQDFGG